MTRFFRIVLCLSALVAFAGPAPAAPRPWRANDRPPAVAGLNLGDSEQQVISALGTPDSVAKTELGDQLDYRTRGLEVIVAKDGVCEIHLMSAAAGDIDGVKIGDSAQDVVLKWGAPKGGQGRTAIFGGRDWGIAVQLADKSPDIVDLALARDSLLAAKQAPQLNVFTTQ
ncbi:MAG TPA: hypothetical protein VHC42_09150 [Rhizomicrobium sp.]|nr:hypothetical protein [Rhizomicrobium sp.]